MMRTHPECYIILFICVMGNFLSQFFRLISLNLNRCRICRQLRTATNFGRNKTRFHGS